MSSTSGLTAAFAVFGSAFVAVIWPNSLLFLGPRLAVTRTKDMTRSPRKTQAESSHARIKRYLLDNIVGGVWQPGFHLPNEIALAQSFGVSRMTMNKVLTQLSQAGYLVRHKKRGTFVAQPRSQSAVMQISSIRQEVADRGEEHSWTLDNQALRTLSEDEHEFFSSMTYDPEQPTLFLEGVHYANTVPFCKETRTINPVVCPQAKDQDFHSLEPGQWLLETVPWIKANHTVRAENASAADAQALGIDPGSACLVMLRQTWCPAGWVTCVRLTHRADTFQLVGQFEPDGLNVPTASLNR